MQKKFREKIVHKKNQRKKKQCTEKVPIKIMHRKNPPQKIVHKKKFARKNSEQNSWAKKK